VKTIDYFLMLTNNNYAKSGISSCSLSFHALSRCTLIPEKKH